MVNHYRRLWFQGCLIFKWCRFKWSPRKSVLWSRKFGWLHPFRKVILCSQYILYSRAVTFSNGLTMTIPQAAKGREWLVMCRGWAVVLWLLMLLTHLASFRGSYANPQWAPHMPTCIVLMAYFMVCHASEYMSSNYRPQHVFEYEEPHLFYFRMDLSVEWPF